MSYSRRYKRELARAKNDTRTNKIMDRYFRKLKEFIDIGDLDILKAKFNDDKVKLSSTDRKALMYAMLNLKQKIKNEEQAKEEADKQIDKVD